MDFGKPELEYCNAVVSILSTLHLDLLLISFSIWKWVFWGETEKTV